MMIEPVWQQFLRRRGFSAWTLLVPFFWLASLIYQAGLALKRKQTPQHERLSIPVVSVGNISVGGTGKTPIVVLLAQQLLANNLRVGIVSSGWGRESKSSFIAPGNRVSTMPIQETGDEIRLLAEALPAAVFSVSPVKWEAAEALAKSNQVDLILVDDGFQHWQLPRDFDIVAFDATIPQKQWQLLPLGRLREPFSALHRANAVIITRSDLVANLQELQRHLKSYTDSAEFYRAEFSFASLVGKQERLPVSVLKDKSVTLFAGIGNFKAFEQQVTALSARIDESIALSDHQAYDTALLAKIAQTGAKHNSDLLVTTGKDWVKLGDFDFGRKIYYLEQAIELTPGVDTLIRQITRICNVKAAQ